MAGRKIRAKAQMIAAYLLEVHDDDVEWDVDRFVVKGAPERFKTMKEIAFAAYNRRSRASSRVWRRSATTTRRT
jgi:carbon-monoxide dehydrogenase large subunit